ncbi:MAG: hypothetical protein PHN22_04845 [Candidatus ainarchaeum sp.]|nr:hypothetical protein [Candidatus ainarchaeum sp.]
MIYLYFDAKSNKKVEIDINETQIIDKQIATGYINNKLTEILSDINVVLKKHNTSDLIYIAMNWREGNLDKERLLKETNNGLISFSISEFVSGSLVLKDILKLPNVVGQTINQDTINEIFKLYSIREHLENIRYLLENGWVIIVDLNKLTDKLLQPTFELDGINYIVLYVKDWNYILDAFGKNNAVTQANLDKNAEKLSQIVKIEEFFFKSKIKYYKDKLQCIKFRCINSPIKIQSAENDVRKWEDIFLGYNLEKFYVTYYNNNFNKDFFDFEFVLNKDNLTFLGLFIRYVQKAYTKDEGICKKLYYEIPFIDYIDFCNRFNFNIDDCNKLIYSYDYTTTPLLIRYSDKLLIGPEFLIMVWVISEYRNSLQQYKSLTSEISGVFEDDVEKIFIKQEYINKDPKNKGQFYKRKSFFIPKLNKKIEFDLIMYNSKTVCVVECKKNNICVGYLSRDIRKSRAENLKDEIIHHKDRVDFIKENLSNLGLSTELNVMGLLVTYVKEDISRHSEIEVISECDLQEYLNKC